ncbi:MAG: zinc-ribbon domain-containing protein [Thermoplasmata archaeon]
MFAIAVGNVSYFEYENDVSNLMRSFWEFMYLVATAPDKNIVAPVIPTPEQQMAMIQNGSPQQVAGTHFIYCKHCGAKIEPDSKFCKFCGGKI